jgi:hypothetical protein
MPEPETHRWWDDVAHLREAIERRREDEARGERVHTRAASAHAVDELERPRAHRSPRDEEAEVLAPVATAAGRFERVGAEPRPRAHAAERVAVPMRPLSPPAPRRRTVEITGRTVGAPSLPRLVEIDRRRPPRRSVERVGPRPDRLAMWAVLLAFFLILVAATSASHAAGF